MKRVFGLALLLCAMACAASAQAVDTTVCAVLKDPASFNGKTVRIKGTVVTGFDQFVITDSDCGKDVNGIWLAYPQGSKAKSGPAEMVELLPAHNFAGKVEKASYAAVTLTRDKAFKQFDSALDQKHEETGGTCLGCPRNQVQATLVGRLDGVADATLQRDAKGKIISLGGFGNLNAYPARLVLESVSDVTVKPIDYSTSDATVKKASSNSRGPQSTNQPYGDPIPAAKKLANSITGTPIADQMKSDAALLPASTKAPLDGVTISYGAINEVGATEAAPAAGDTPDGVNYICTFDRGRLSGLPMVMALLHASQHVADERTPRPGNELAPLYILESNAWAVSATAGIAGGEKFMILPGGFLMWDASWPDGDKINNMEAALNDFLGKQEMLNR